MGIRRTQEVSKQPPGKGRVFGADTDREQRERGADSAEMVSSVQEEESEAEQKMERGLSSLWWTNNCATLVKLSDTKTVLYWQKLLFQKC